MCGKRPVASESGAGTVGGYNSEMVPRVRTQAADVGADVPERVPRLIVGSSGETVADRRAVLEINRGDQPMRIKRAIERG